MALKKNNNYNIGCGHTVGKNWNNYDPSIFALIDQIPFFSNFFQNKTKFPKGIIYGNIVKKKFCKNNEADNIFLSHVLEHVDYQNGKIMLRNIYEMLKPNGVLRIIVPCLNFRISEYILNGDADEFMKNLGVFNLNKNDFISSLRFYFGGSRHRWMYDENSLIKILNLVGFTNIRKCKFNDSNIDAFNEIERKDRFVDNKGRNNSIALHCIK